MVNTSSSRTKAEFDSILKKRGLNKNMLYLLLEQYTRWLENTYYINLDSLWFSNGDMIDVVSEFVESHPITISTILREQ